MLLRNVKVGLEGLVNENAFEIVDERSGARIGLCSVIDEHNEAMFPQRPHQTRLEFEGEVDDRLLGAALARANELCALCREPSRIYAVCEPDDEELMELLKPYGFKDNDGIVRMRADLPVSIETRAPTGCALVRDALTDPTERKYFLERFNQIFGLDYDMAWLAELTGKQDFTRLLTVAPTGMAGEVVIWTEKGYGVIGFLETARRWRNMGVAKYMLQLALAELRTRRLPLARADVRARMPYVLRTMEAAGFWQEKLLMRYPGKDI